MTDRLAEIEAALSQLLPEYGHHLDLLESRGVLNADDVRWLVTELRTARSCITQHHAVGVMDAARVGEKCPVCTRFDLVKRGNNDHTS